MKANKLLCVSIATAICILSFKTKTEPMIILPLHPYNIVSILDKKDTSKGKYYFIKGFKSYVEDSILLDSFVKKNIDKDYAKYS